MTEYMQSDWGKLFCEPGEQWYTHAVHHTPLSRSGCDYETTQLASTQMRLATACHEVSIDFVIIFMMSEQLLKVILCLCRMSVQTSKHSSGSPLSR